MLAKLNTTETFTVRLNINYDNVESVVGNVESIVDNVGNVVGNVGSVRHLSNMAWSDCFENRTDVGKAEII